MKSIFTAMTLAVMLATCPTAYADEDKELEAALVKATSAVISVAPWIKLSIDNVEVEDRLTWTAQTSTGQRFACSIEATAEALISGKALCNRTAPSAEVRAASDGRPVGGSASRPGDPVLPREITSSLPREMGMSRSGMGR